MHGGRARKFRSRLSLAAAVLHLVNLATHVICDSGGGGDGGDGGGGGGGEEVVVVVVLVGNLGPTC